MRKNVSTIGLLLHHVYEIVIGHWPNMIHEGRIQDFHLGGGGAQRGTELTFGRGPGYA